MAVLGSTSLTGCNSIPDFIAAGSLMLFQQTSAPTGWTKQTTHNDKALRVVSGAASSGGTTAFTSVFASRIPAGTVDSTTLTTAQIPSHSHTVSNVCTFAGDIDDPGGGGNNHANTVELGTSSVGGGESHTHSFTATAMDFAVQYVDLIICSKDP